MVNYDNIRGVGYTHWEGDDDTPAEETREIVVEEFYYDEYSGELHLSFVREDDLEVLAIPVKASEDWNEFVESLPTWDV